MRLPRWSLGILLLSALLLRGDSSGAPATAWQERFPGISCRREFRRPGEGGPLHLYIVQVDLRDPRVQIRVASGGAGPDGKWPSRLAQPSAVAAREGFDVAVNGDFFSARDRRDVLGQSVPYFEGNPARPHGLAMTDGRLWYPGPGTASLAMVVFKSGKVSMGFYSSPPPGAWQMVGGGTLLVNNGKPIRLASPAAPRTAVGIDRKGTTLTLVVVDGRRPDYSVGLTEQALAEEMVRLGCDRAINLDGGGSSTLVMRDPETGKCEVVNRPSDGHQLPLPLSIERPVCSTLGITTRRP